MKAQLFSAYSGGSVCEDHIIIFDAIAELGMQESGKIGGKIPGTSRVVITAVPPGINR